MPTYDLQDPTDLDIVRGLFDRITHEEWDEYIELAEERSIGYKNVNILKSVQRKTGLAKYLSPKVLSWVISLVERLDEDEDDDEEE